MTRCVHNKDQHLCNFCWKKDQFDVCSQCSVKFTDPANRESIQHTGSCLNCDHILGDIIEQQLADAVEMEVA